MTNITLFPRHNLLRCGVNYPYSDSCDLGNCQFCSGGLAFCLTCRGGEGELPTDCPQTPMHRDEKLAVYNGHLDFKGGRWVCISEEAKGVLR